MKSVPPPGVDGMIMRMGWFGYACANASPEVAASAAPAMSCLIILVSIIFLFP